MTLQGTTILPADDPALAQRMFRDLIFEEPLVLLVVLGTDTAAERLIQRADKLSSFPRRVVWVRRPDDVEPVLRSLKGDPALLSALDTSRAFSLSLSDTVCDVIPGSRDEPDMVRILQAFLRAEQGDS